MHATAANLASQRAPIEGIELFSRSCRSRKSKRRGGGDAGGTAAAAGRSEEGEARRGWRTLINEIDVGLFDGRGGSIVAAWCGDGFAGGRFVLQLVPIPRGIRDRPQVQELDSRAAVTPLGTRRRLRNSN